MAAQLSPVEVPLFPLNTVLYPGGQLQLRIFEPRYLDLVRECTRTGSSFGVCLILQGNEVGTPALPAAVGTLASIADFSHGSDGLLGIAVQGGQRFRVLHTRVRSDGLMRGHVQQWPAEEAQPVPVEFSLLPTILERLIETMGPQWRHAERSCYDDAGWVGFRLAELLPLEGEEQQQLLEMTDPVQRLVALRDILPRFQKG
ncbi:MAG TPA: LON peptidase substrate-binding domain-containing protein [Dyella sp.]|uniref:LON peptidase substrate-binding domain-containing protein n=1 Tax=Dyella sp. TaxID=1869338 RepID=UPI002BF0F547|nr:LON peptidase substrate-binding domain-containing protein [Dyella sp.]HTV85238.1 LON peptidase substrate-binding domain-containing protein [Dyella sp.]